MINSEILTYVRQQLALGTTREQISHGLKSNGWTDQDIDQAFRALNPVVSTPAPVVPPPIAVQPVVAQPIVIQPVVNVAPVTMAEPVVTQQPVASVVIQPTPVQPVMNTFVPNTVVQSTVETQKKSKIWPYVTIFFLIPLLIMAGLVYISYNMVVSGVNNIAGSLTAEDINFDEYIVTISRAPDAENGYYVLEGLDEELLMLEPSDRTYILLYLENYKNPGKLDLKEAERILTKYKKLSDVFEQVVDKEYYQCQGSVEGGTCYFIGIRSMSVLASLQSLYLYNTGKIEDSRILANKIVKLGDMIINSGHDLVTTLVSTAVHGEAYKVLNIIKGDTRMSDLDKNNRLAEIRNAHRDTVKKDYTQLLELVGYVDDPSKKIGNSLFYIQEEINDVRSLAIEGVNWNSYATKKLFYDTMIVDLANFDAPCGSAFVDSYIDVQLKSKDVDLDKIVGEINVGEYIYTQMYMPYETVVKDSCKIQDLIKTL